MFLFTIIDYNTNPLGVATSVDEPEGFDDVDLRLKRDPELHGFFEFFDDAIMGLKWRGEANNILRNAYATYGIDAELTIKIEYECSETDTTEVLYTGRFSFSQYKEVCGTDCYTECSIESTNCFMKWKNRNDQKVNLDSLRDYDTPCVPQTVISNSFFTAPHSVELPDLSPDLLSVGTQITVSGSLSNNGTFTITAISNNEGGAVLAVEETVVDEFGTSINIDACLFTDLLPAYDALGQNIRLEGIILKFANRAKNDAYRQIIYTDDILYSTPATPINTPAFYYFTIGFDHVFVSDLLTFDAGQYSFKGKQDDYPVGTSFNEEMAGNTSALFEQSNFNSKLRCNSDVLITTRLKGVFEYSTVDTVNGAGAIDLIKFDAEGKLSMQITLVDDLDIFANTDSIPFDITDVRTISFTSFEKIYLVLRLSNVRYLSGGGSGTIIPTAPFNIALRLEESSIDMESISYCQPSPAKSYLVNETLSRIAEAYTNDCLRVYSDYFGRPDAQPYPSEALGCAGYEAVTNGLLIRQARQIDGSENNFKASFKDLFKGLSDIHNLGVGIEADPNRPGNDLLRVEPYKHFYNDTVLMLCDSPEEVSLEPQDPQYITTFKIGYAKSETEEVNGLYDIHGKREYRTEIRDSKNELSRMSALVASGHAIEVTRRKYGSGTTDWKYDNDTFIICASDRADEENEVEGEFSAPNGAVPPFAIIVSGIIPMLYKGDLVTISGTASNDGTYTLAEDATYGFGNTLINVKELIVTEAPLSFTLQITRVGLVNETFPLVDGTTAFNMNGPETTYNLRITPARNAMRWFSRIQQNNKTANSKLIFTDGTGNKIGASNLGAYSPCPEEAVTIYEDNDIAVSTFGDIAEAQAKYTNEYVTFKYPVSHAQLAAILANPYGKIGWKCPGMADYAYGWIMDFKREFPTGLTEFTLKPEYIQL